MKKITKWIVAVLAAALLAGNLSGCGALGPVIQLFSEKVAEIRQNEEETTAFATEEVTEETTSAAQTETEQESTTAQEPETPAATLTESGVLPEYEHYDPADFLANVTTMQEYADAGSMEQAYGLYAQLYNDLLHILNLRVTANIRSSEQASDQYWQEEAEYMQDILLETSDEFFAACKTILNGKNGAAFEKLIDDEAAVVYYNDYEKLSDEQKNLYVEETKLSNDYYEVMDHMNDITCTYKGEEYRFGDILEENNTLSEADRSTFLAVFEDCYKQLNEQAGAIFLKLVKVRDRIAKLAGYDNYNDYADEEVYNRDYSSSDLEKMKTAARRFGSEYQEYMYYAYSMLPDYSASGDQLVEDAKNTLSGISPLVDQVYRYLSEEKPYSIGDDESRVNGAFTTDLYGLDAPAFIFAKTSSEANDLITLIHESGHYTNFYFNPNPHPLFSDGSLDLAEIHSTGLQLLAGDKLEKIFGEDAAAVNAFNVLNLISYVSEGCLYDEWQREIYENPDMTLEEINDLFQKISEEYGVQDYTAHKYSWIEVNHNFESPLYYISYATSAFASLQIYLNSRSDYGSAVGTWEEIIKAGNYEEGYMSVVKEAGLKTFDDASAVYDVLSRVFEYAQMQLLGFAY